jgi:RHS repeat-associated protein
MSDGTGTVSYAYDDNGMKTGVTTTYTGLSPKTVSYSYFPDGQQEAVGTPGGSFNYSYDRAGRLTSLTNPEGETSSWSYLGNNWFGTQSLGNGVTTTYSENARGYVTSLVTETSTSAILSDFSGMAYDALGDRTAMTASIPGQTAYSGSTSYGYDTVTAHGTRSRIISESSTRNGGYSQTNAYDTAGNPATLRSVSTGSYNSDNQTTSSSYAYDGNGNPTTYSGTSLTFDAENRMTSFGTVQSSGYNGDDLRAWKTNSSGTTYYLYDGTHPICELNTSGAITAVNTFGACGLLSRYSGSSSTFYTFDPQGNPVQRLDSNANILTTSSFDAFGDRNTTNTNSDPFCGYGAQCGYYLDTETGLQLLSHRYFDAALGRFINRDPAGVGVSINPYEYCKDNPVSLNDPSGYSPFEYWELLVACAGAAVEIIGIAAGTPSSCGANTVCKSLLNCLAGMLGVALSAYAGACAGSALSALLDYFLDKLCDNLFNCNKKPGNFMCDLYGALVDAALGCISSLIIGFDETSFEQSLASMVMDLLGIDVTSYCDSKGGGII